MPTEAIPMGMHGRQFVHCIVVTWYVGKHHDSVAARVKYRDRSLVQLSTRRLAPVRLH